MLIPPYLKKGDTIGLLSTARKMNHESLTGTLAMLDSWGLKVVQGKTIGAEDNQYAGPDALRTKDLQDFIDDPSIQAILCVRGGYGTMRILDTIDFTGLKKNPKWICGFSDVTALHAHLNCVVGIAGIHSSMPSLFPKDLNAHPVTVSLRMALFGEELSYKYDHKHSYQEGNVKGVLVGGNLSLIYALQGSVSDLKTDGCILFIEDLDEYLYHVDRMMLSLDRAGKFKNLSGLIVGGMTEMKDNSVPFGKNAVEIIWEYASKYNFPVCFDFPSGHIETNLALRLGTEAELKVGQTHVLFKQ